MNNENNHNLDLIQKTLDYAENIIATVREPLVILNGDLRIISANRSFYSTFKVNPKETEQELIYNLGNSQWNIPKLQQLLEKILPTKTTIEDYEVEHLFEDIGQKTMLINARKIINEEEKEELILLAIDDITEQKKYDELCIRTQKIEALGSLAGGIAHDFNNILMGILGNISLAKIKFPKDHPGYKYLEESEQSISRATNLANKLLTFSSGGSPIKENIILGKLIEEVVRFDLTGSNVKFYFKQAEDLWLANIDKTQIQQVFSNLTINANQAMPNGGILYITLENADIKDNTVRGLKQGKYIKATVQDEGIGIDYKNHDRVFHPFFSTKDIGRGLGLPTAYSIIKKHDGFINFDSELGKGTTFTLYIPTSETQAHPKAKKSDVTEYPKIQHISRILVMEDEEQISNFLKSILEEYGFSVSTAIEGKQAIEIYKQSLNNGEPFGAVILDLTIPGGIGGKEVVKELLKVDPDAKCIVSSGYANDPVIANYVEYGFKGILTKPYTPNKMLEVLSQIMKE